LVKSVAVLATDEEIDFAISRRKRPISVHIDVSEEHVVVRVEQLLAIEVGAEDKVEPTRVAARNPQILSDLVPATNHSWLNHV